MSIYVNSLILKIASRCNLNCSYCYMYNKGDLSYMSQPKLMSEEIIRSVVDAAYTHAHNHAIKKFNFIFHGGEPLLAGMDLLAYFLGTARRKFRDSGIELSFTIQTNGTLLSPGWCEFIGENGIGLGISLDGTKEMNDLARKDHAGRGSYDAVITGIRNAMNCDKLKSPPAILLVVNPDYDPEEILDHFISIGIKAFDFLLPDNNHVEKPLLPSNGRFAGSETPYGDWVIELYDLWKRMSHDSRPHIRTFQDIMWKFLGGTIDCDVLGNDYNRALVIETDGGLEAVDSLKICGESFTKEHANILRDTIDDALNLPLARLYFESHKKLCAVCANCEISELCGGGFIAHRYKSENKFDNPSVYCRDYCKFLSHIQNDLVDDLSQELVGTANLERVNYDNLILNNNV